LLGASVTFQGSDVVLQHAVFAGLVVLMLISLALPTILKLIEKKALGRQNAKGVIRTDEPV